MDTPRSIKNDHKNDREVIHKISVYISRGGGAVPGCVDRPGTLTRSRRDTPRSIKNDHENDLS